MQPRVIKCSSKGDSHTLQRMDRDGPGEHEARRIPLVADERERRTIVELPPGASLSMSTDGAVIDFPMWAYWLRIAHDEACEAERLQPPYDYFDRVADALDTIGSEVPPGEQTDHGAAVEAIAVALA